MWRHIEKLLILAALTAGAAAQQEQQELSVLARGLLGAGAGVSFLAAGALTYFLWSKICTPNRSGGAQVMKPCTQTMSDPIMNNRLTLVYDSLLLAKHRWSADPASAGESSRGVKTGHAGPDLEQGIRAHYDPAISLDDESTETVSSSTSSNPMDK